MSPPCKMADNERLTVDQNVKVVLFYAETKSVVATQRSNRAHFGTRWASCKQTIYRLPLGTIFQPMRINSLPDFKRFVTIKLCNVYNQWYDISCATLKYRSVRGRVWCFVAKIKTFKQAGSYLCHDQTSTGRTIKFHLSAHPYSVF